MKGSVIREASQIAIRGFRDYFHLWSNLLTLFQVALYAVAYSLRFYSIIRVAGEKKKLSDPFFWNAVRNLTKDDIEAQKNIYETFYWLNNGIFD